MLVVGGESLSYVLSIDKTTNLLDTNPAGMLKFSDEYRPLSG